MNCPRYGNINRCKDGVVKDSQRYKCEDCKNHYTVEQKSNEKSRQTKRLAIEMYLEGMGFRAIGRVLKISHVTVIIYIYLTIPLFCCLNKVGNKFFIFYPKTH
ncbi:MAG: hypothetical protein LBE13_11815 [Bacteroidales bacterium]|jgi:transposase-like protein|nr:hypothetical protein [Bacteroidales bacterium]